MRHVRCSQRRREFELLKLLATDKKALATARRLGAFHILTRNRPHSQSLMVLDRLRQAQRSERALAPVRAQAAAAQERLWAQ